jgi:hypothetical protein
MVVRLDISVSDRQVTVVSSELACTRIAAARGSRVVVVVIVLVVVLHALIIANVPHI